jgi:hypothetical protein
VNFVYTIGSGIGWVMSRLPAVYCITIALINDYSRIMKYVLRDIMGRVSCNWVMFQVTLSHPLTMDLFYVPELLKRVQNMALSRLELNVQCRNFEDAHNSMYYCAM